MEAEIDRINSKFGIEVEFYIVDQKGYPVLNSYNSVAKECLEKDPTLMITNETCSYQIEINPGPWPLTEAGLKIGLEELDLHYNIIKRVVGKHNWKLCETLMPCRISQEIINHPDFTTKNTRYDAFAKYFKKNNDVILQNDEQRLAFPGEMILGCINEIHIHVQLSTDKQNIDLFNYLNFNGLELTAPFNQPAEINHSIFNDTNSLLIFERANGEWNDDHTVNRVGNLPQAIHSYQEYQSILDSFERIPLDENSYLEPESCVYFWTRLRGVPGDLK